MCRVYQNELIRAKLFKEDVPYIKGGDLQYDNFRHIKKK